MDQIELQAAGDEPVKVIKVLREWTGWKLAEAKNVVDTLPRWLTAPDGQAEAYAAALQGAGATVFVGEQQAAAPAPAAPQPDPLEQLERLGRLRESGAIDDAEFQRLKAQLL